jgi:phosphohistidine phosphatase
MSKQLLVMRHAKSSWANPGLTDFQRPLNKRGLRVAPQVGAFVHQQGLVPDLVVSSTAVRAKTTAEIFIQNCEGVGEDQLNVDQDFYHAPASVYLDYLNRFSDESANTLMFVGHNPGLEDLVERLSGGWEILPTAAVAHFDLGADRWSDIVFSRATLKNLWRPKEIHIA